MFASVGSESTVVKLYRAVKFYGQCSNRPSIDRSGQILAGTRSNDSERAQTRRLGAWSPAQRTVKKLGCYARCQRRGAHRATVGEPLNAERVRQAGECDSQLFGPMLSKLTRLRVLAKPVGQELHTRKV